MKRLALAAACLATMLMPSAHAQYPEKPITWIVPFAPGGVTDATSRQLAERLGAELGQHIIVENKPGAGGILGTSEARRARPDGYTVVFASSGPMAIQPAIDPSRLPFDPLKDFTFIHGVSLSPQLITAAGKAPYDTIEALVAHAKANPGKLNFGSPGIGTAQHIGGELFAKAAGIELTHVPYTSGATQMVDLSSGTIDLSFEYFPIVQPHVQQGKMKVLGSTGAERSPATPDVVTVAEAGYPGAVNLGWTFLAAPAGLPDDVRERLVKGMDAVMSDPAVIQMIESDGRGVLNVSGHDASVTFIRSEIDKFKAVAQGVDLR